MYLIQLILGTNATPSGATPLIPKTLAPANSRSFSHITIQYNGTGTVRVGDATVSASRGILLSPGNPAGTQGGSSTITPSLQFSGDLTEFYFFGTAGQPVDILVLD